MSACTDDVSAAGGRFRLYTCKHGVSRRCGIIRRTYQRRRGFLFLL